MSFSKNPFIFEELVLAIVGNIMKLCNWPWLPHSLFHVGSPGLIFALSCRSAVKERPSIVSRCQSRCIAWKFVISIFRSFTHSIVASVLFVLSAFLRNCFSVSILNCSVFVFCLTCFSLVQCLMSWTSHIFSSKVFNSSVSPVVFLLTVSSARPSQAKPVVAVFFHLQYRVFCCHAIHISSPCMINYIISIMFWHKL